MDSLVLLGFNSVIGFLYIIDLFMCLWLVLLVFEYIIIDLFICLRWFFCISPRNYPSTSFLNRI